MSTLDVEITSPTTATAVWPGSDPIELHAADRTALSAKIYHFSQSRAAAVDGPVEVRIVDGGRQRGVTVTPDGQAAQSMPSGPLPVVPVDQLATTPVGDEADEPAPGPVTVTAEAIEPAVITADAVTYDHTPPAPRPDAAEPTDPEIPASQRTPTDSSKAVSAGAEHTVSRTASGHSPAPGPTPRPRPVDDRPEHQRITRPVESTGHRPLPSLTAQRRTQSEPARQGLRGRLNALGLHLAPRPASSEMRIRDAIATITAPISDFKRVTVANLKGGVGKTPIALGLSATIATHRGAGTVVCADLAEVGGSLGDRAAVPPGKDQNIGAILAAADDITRRSSTLSWLLTRQPTGEDIAAGRQGLAGAEPLDAQQAATLGQLLALSREILIADTGNNQLAGSWQWAIAHSDVLVVPVPLRRDAAIAAVRMLIDISDIDPGVLARTLVIVTDGPGDQPMVETEAVDAFVRLDVAKVLRMPYEPLFAGGEPIIDTQLRATTVESLTVIAAAVVELMNAPR